MSRDNTVTLVGNLVEDPELRFTASGVAMVNIRIAVSRRYQDRNNEWQEQTTFTGGTVWRDLAENVAESLTKGMRVIITGELDQRQWETADGEKRSILEIRIDDIAPSLRWATASVTRTPRSGGSGNFGGGGGGGGSSTPPGPVAPRDNYDPDEAPF